jgi:type IV pilus biogenesis protein PilP
MKSDRAQGIANMSTRQKVTIGVFVVVIIVVIWQVIGLFKGDSQPAAVPAPTMAGTGQPGMPSQVMPAQPPAPKPAAAPLSQREIELMRLQQETEAKYIAAINELQMLKVQKDIAETNKAIATAKLDTVTAQKGIVQMLEPQAPPPTPADYAQSLVNQTASAQGAGVRSGEVSYTVISVSKTQSRWNAVLGYQGNLYSVAIGDVLPADGSKVISIDRTGVVLEKDDVKKKVSLVSII